MIFGEGGQGQKPLPPSPNPIPQPRNVGATRWVALMKCGVGTARHKLVAPVCNRCRFGRWQTRGLPDNGVPKLELENKIRDCEPSKIRILIN
jgi:hypothetical protein